MQTIIPQEEVSVCVQSKLLSLKYPKVFDIGKKLFQIHSQTGVPLEMIIDKMPKIKEKGKNTKLVILDGFLSERLQHKVKSGIQEKQLLKEQERNRQELLSFFQTGEFPII